MNSQTPHYRLRTYLLWTFLPLATVPLLILAALSHYWVGEVVDKSVERRAETEVLGLNRNFEIVEKRLSQELQSFSRDPELVVAALSSDPQLTASVLTRWVPVSRFKRLTLFNSSGRKIFEFDQGMPPLKKWEGLFPRTGYSARRKPASEAIAKTTATADLLNDRQKLLKVVKQEGTLVTRRKSTAAPFEFVIHQRVLDSDSKFSGYMEGVLPLYQDLVNTLAEHQDMYLAVESIDENKKVYSTSFPSVSKFFSGQLEGITNMNFDGEENTVIKRTISSDLSPQLASVFIGVGKGEANRIQKQILILISILTVGLCAVAVLLTLAFSKKITRPMTLLVEAMEALREGDWVQPLVSDSKSEVGYLVNRFNEMVQSVQVTKRTLELKLEELAYMNQTLHQTQDQLIQSAKLSSLGQLVAGVAHELNNPIAFIYSNMTQMKSSLKMLRDMDAELKNTTAKLGADDQKAIEKLLEKYEWDLLKKDLEDISQSCLEGAIRVKDIVLGLRNFSRLDQGEFKEVDLSENLRNTVKLLSSQLRNRIEIQWHLAESNFVFCNPSQMNQVFVNLIANAAQSIPGKGKITVSTTWDGARSEWRLSLRDTGVGIPKDVLSRIFDPFFTTKKVGEGTGLGLAIVYGIIDKHQGKIRVNSSTQPSTSGTEFTIMLPRSQRMVAPPPPRKVSNS